MKRLETESLRRFIVIFALTGVGIDICTEYIIEKINIEPKIQDLILNLIGGVIYTVLAVSMTWYAIRKITGK